MTDVGDRLSQESRAARLGLGVLCCAALLYEVALTRLSSVLLYTHLTSIVIAACMAALGLGAAHAHRRAVQGMLSGAFLERAAAWTAASAALAVVAAAKSPAGFALGLFALPLFWVGAYAGAAYVVIGRGPGLTYAADLLGGASGALLAPPLLSRLGDVDTALAAATLAGLAALHVRGAGRGLPWWFVPAPALLVLDLLVPGGVVAVDPYAEFGFRPHLVEQTRERGGRVVATAYDSYARTDLVETDEPWVRYLFTDRMYAARIARWDGRSERFADAELSRLSRLKGLPFRALRPRRVLVLGAGGGFDVALALQGGARGVDAVEVNAAMIRFTRALSAFCGAVYDRPEVRVRHAEARRFVRDCSERYDLVDLSLMQTDPAGVRGNAGVQDWVFTVEAIGDYLDHLAPRGAIAIVQNTEAAAVKTVATALAALGRRDLAADAAARRLAVLALPEAERNPFTHLVLVGREGLDGEALAALAAGEGLRVLYLYEIAAREPFAALASGVAAHPAPPTDEMPYFYALPPVVVLLFSTVLALAAVLLLLAFARDHSLSVRDAGACLEPRGWLAATALGAGFMTAQSGLMHRAQLLLGHTPLAVSAVLGGMLFFAGCGAVLLGGLAPARPGRRLALAAATTTVLLLLASRASARLPELLRGAGDVTEGLTLAALLAAVSLPAGACLPACMERFAGRGQRAAAAVLTADGLAAVAGAAAGSLVAVGHGTSWFFRFAAAGYAVAAVAGLGGEAEARGAARRARGEDGRHGGASAPEQVAFDGNGNTVLVVPGEHA